MKTSTRTLSPKKMISLLLMAIVLGGFNALQARDYYQLKTYLIEDDEQEARLDEYLEEAYLPALHRAGIDKVGVFKPRPEDAHYGEMLMVLIPFESLSQFAALPDQLSMDRKYLQQGRDYIDASHDDPPYARIKSVLLRAFTAMPEAGVPEHETARKDQIYELRSYHGATEQLYETKVEMFSDEGETELFIELGFQPVFFGEVLSGDEMPNLMYLTTHANQEAQDQNWDAFRNHPEWNRMKGMEKYANTVSHIDKYMLYPTDYSDL